MKLVVEQPGEVKAAYSSSYGKLLFALGSIRIFTGDNRDNRERNYSSVFLCFLLLKSVLVPKLRLFSGVKSKFLDIPALARATTIFRTHVSRNLDSTPSVAFTPFAPPPLPS